MMKVALAFLALLVVLASPAAAKENHGVLETMSIEGGGFYYYDDYKPEDVNKTKPIKKRVEASPVEKAKFNQMERVIQAMEKNNELQEKILAKLEYAFPRTIPEYTINKKTGEKCKSNSSADCFVMPVIKEAQNSAPVMVEMLRNPTTETVKNYLEWQSVYFQQSFQIGRGFQLVSKQFEREVNKFDGTYGMQMPDRGNKQNEVANIGRSAAIMKLKHKLGVLVFMGKNRSIDRGFGGTEYVSILYTILPRLDNFALVFPSQEDYNYITAKVESQPGNTDTIKKWKSAKVIINPNLFEKYKINISPSAVLFYKKDDGETVWQKLGYSLMSSEEMVKTIYTFLKFHKIVEPGTINEADAFKMYDELVVDGVEKNDYIDKIKINEGSINVDESQIIKKGENAK